MVDRPARSLDPPLLSGDVRRRLSEVLTDDTRPPPADACWARAEAFLRLPVALTAAAVQDGLCGCLAWDPRQAETLRRTMEQSAIGAVLAEQVRERRRRMSRPTPTPRQRRAQRPLEEWELDDTDPGEEGEEEEPEPEETPEPEAPPSPEPPPPPPSEDDWRFVPPRRTWRWDWYTVLGIAAFLGALTTFVLFLLLVLSEPSTMAGPGDPPGVESR